MSWVEATLNDPLGVLLRKPFLEFITDEVFDLADVDNDGIANEAELQTFSNIIHKFCFASLWNLRQKSRGSRSDINNECTSMGKILAPFLDR